MINYSNAIRILTVIILLMIIALISPYVYYKFYPFKPILTINSPFPVTKTSIKAGEEMGWTAKFCKNDSSTAHTKAVLITKLKQIKMYEAEFNGEKGCFNVNRSIVIPEDAPAGEAEIDFYTDYIYPFNRVVPVRGRTVTFNIESSNITSPINQKNNSK